jgi:hypothetical protein
VTSEPQPRLRSPAVAGLAAFAGTMVFQYALIIATLGWSTVTKIDGWTNWALIAAAKTASVALVVAAHAVHRRWVVLRTRGRKAPALRFSLVPVAALLAFLSRWMPNEMVYDSFGVTPMADYLWYAGIPAMLVLTSLLPLNFAVTACGAGATFSGIVMASGGTVHTAAFSSIYAAASPLIGSLFAILCLGGGGGMTLRHRLVQHAGVGFAFVCFYGPFALPIRGTPAVTLGLLGLILGAVFMPGIPIWIERRLRMAAQARPPNPP